MNALEEHLLNEYVAPELPEDGSEVTETERFKLTNDQMANWALRKIAKIRSEREADEELAAAERARIDAWLIERQKQAQRNEEFFVGLLAAYFAPKHAENPKTKTFKLPAGSVQFRAQQPSFTRDDSALVDWLKKNGLADFVETVENPKWGELKKELTVAKGRAYLKSTGEEIPCVTVEERPEIVRVEVG